MQNHLSPITLIYVGPAPAEGVRLPAGSISHMVQPFEPFEATNAWLRRMTGRTSRFWTPAEYSDHCNRCADGQLKAMLPLRKIAGTMSREEMIKALTAGIFDEPKTLVYTEADLRVACHAAGLPADGDRDALLKRLGLDARLKTTEPTKPVKQAPKPAEVVAQAQPLFDAPKPAPDMSPKVAALKAALLADDYPTVWDLATDLTSDRPASRGKAVVYAWARELIAAHEG